MHGQSPLQIAAVSNHNDYHAVMVRSSVNFNKTIAQAIKEMNKKKLGLVVITKNNTIKGIITDGDARREIKNYSNNDNVAKFMTKNPLSITENTPASKALAIMNKKEVTSLLVFADSKSNKNKLKKLKGILHIHSLLQYGVK